MFSTRQRAIRYMLSVHADDKMLNIRKSVLDGLNNLECGLVLFFNAMNVDKFSVFSDISRKCGFYKAYFSPCRPTPYYLENVTRIRMRPAMPMEQVMELNKSNASEINLEALTPTQRVTYFVWSITAPPLDLQNEDIKSAVHMGNDDYVWAGMA